MDLVSNDVLLLVTENLNEKLNKEIKKCSGRVFILIKTMIVDDSYITIIQQEHNGSVYRLISRVTKLPNKILEVTTENTSWKNYIEQGLKSLTCNISPLVVIKTHLDSSLKIVHAIENIKSKISFR